ncbi:MAG: hypothetical protein ABIR55_05465 [Burkholderiaceae bacterium]
MSVQTMDSINPAETAPETPAIDSTQVPDAASTEQAKTYATSEGQDKPQEPQGKPERKPGVQSRIDELTRARHQAEREATFWREQAAKSPPSSTDAPDRPSKAAFTDDDAYFEALADWKAEQKVQQFSRQTQAERAQEADARQQDSRFDLYRERVQQSADAMPDYETVVGESEVPAAPHVLDSILDSDVGPQLAYHLAKNPDVAERLNAMTPMQAAREIGRLEASVTAAPASAAPIPPPKRTTQAPAPITPVRGQGGQFTKPEGAMSDSEWYAANRPN